MLFMQLYYCNWSAALTCLLKGRNYLNMSTVTKWML